MKSFALRNFTLNFTMPRLILAACILCFVSLSLAAPTPDEIPFWDLPYCYNVSDSSTPDTVYQMCYGFFGEVIAVCTRKIIITETNLTTKIIVLKYNYFRKSSLGWNWISC